jgi:hypothetical protein
VRSAAVVPFLNQFPDKDGLLYSDEGWRRRTWGFARTIEDDFIRLLASLCKPGGFIYLADTVHVCWLEENAGEFMTEGAWIATRTNRLADYVEPDFDVYWERGWDWYREEGEGPYWGRLYGVQALLCSPTN